MTWQLALARWLVQAALGGSLFLAAGCLAVRACRQPVRRIRLVELTLAGALLVPWTAGLAWLPHWSAGWLDLGPVTDIPSPLTASSGTTSPGRLLLPAPEPAPATEPLPATLPAAPAAPAAAASLPEPAAPQAPSWPFLLLAVYGAAVAALLMHSLLGLLRLAWLYGTASAASPGAQDVWREVAGDAGQHVRLLASDRIELPLMFALHRPVILLPACLCRDSLRYCLAHEWSHVERGDAWRWYLATLARFLFFWQPLFWWLRRQLRLCQDYLADARAAEQAAETEDYADYLVGLARRRLGAPVAGLGIGDRRSNLYRRILMLLSTPRPLERRCRPAWSAAAGCAALGLLLGLSAIRLDACGEKAVPARETSKQDEKKGKTLHYSGKVTDKDTGKPIAGAVVTVRRSLLGDPEQKEHNPILQETRHTTDAEGKYHFTIPPEQSSQRYLYISLGVEHENYAPRRGFGYALSMIRKNEKLGGRPFFEHVELWPGKPITGAIQTPEGKPAKGIKVLAFSMAGKLDLEFESHSFADTRTDANGRFRLVLATPGTAVFWILPADYAPSVHAVPTGKRGDMGTFALRDGIRLKGRVLDTRGKPMAGVIVNAQLREHSEALQGLPVADSIGRAAVTDAKGEFVLRPLPGLGRYEVKPSERGSEPSDDKQLQRPLPEVFLGQMVVLKEGVEPEPLEVRAAPSVVVEAQYIDSKGKPTRGHPPHISGQIDKRFWYTRAKADINGKMTLRVPHGLENTSFQLSTNEHGALRWRKARGEPLNNLQVVDLGTLNDDVRGIEIVRYVAPILLVKVKAKDGGPLKEPAVMAAYGEGRATYPDRQKSAQRYDVSFEHQEDGRFRSEQLLPDEENTVNARDEGCVSRDVQIKLAEDDKKDI